MILSAVSPLTLDSIWVRVVEGSVHRGWTDGRTDGLVDGWVDDGRTAGWEVSE